MSSEKTRFCTEIEINNSQKHTNAKYSELATYNLDNHSKPETNNSELETPFLVNVKFLLAGNMETFSTHETDNDSFGTFMFHI